jgi:3D (Asp-Asp-Asp) domain-containing protein
VFPRRTQYVITTLSVLLLLLLAATCEPRRNDTRSAPQTRVLVTSVGPVRPPVAYGDAADLLRPTPTAPSAPAPPMVHHYLASGALHDVTAYCGGGTTASGRQVYEGEVATIRRDVPFGTRVRIGDLGTFVVEDRIGHGSEFDVYMSSCSRADEFGRRRLTVELLG